MDLGFTYNLQIHIELVMFHNLPDYRCMGKPEIQRGREGKRGIINVRRFMIHTLP